MTFITYENLKAENKIRVVKNLLFTSFSVLLVDIMQASPVSTSSSLKNMVVQGGLLLTPGGKVLHYMGYIGTCRGIGYGFWRFWILK